MAILLARSILAQGVVYATPSPPLYYGPGFLIQNIDITGSGDTNFVLVCDGGGEVNLYPQGSNSMIVAPIPGGGTIDQGYTLVAALAAGELIGPANWPTNSGRHWFDMATSPINYSQIGAEIGGADNQIYVSSYFAGLATAYLGFDLIKNGTNFYGWMEIENPYPLVSGAIVRWAYSTLPDRPIVAGAGLIMPLAMPQIIRPGNLRLNWQSQIDQAYQVQFKEQLDASAWTNLDLTIIATTGTVAVDVPIVGTTRFYRVIEVP